MRTYSKDDLDKRAVMPLVPEKFHRVIPQRGVKQYVFSAETRHNAMWDYFITKDGRHFFAECAEGDFSETFVFCEYFPETNTVEKIFKMSEAVVNYPRTIKASKIHSSIAELPDGRLIFLSHTTAAAPSHPLWMPLPYYSHMWEGFPGSNLMIYDPASKKVEDLGIPVPRESLYGGNYCGKTNSYYAVGMMRGHVYRISLDSRRVTDYGNLMESSGFRTVVGSDGNVYFSTGAGELARINTDKDRFEYLDVRRHGYGKGFFHGINDRDGRLVCEPSASPEIYAFDPRTGEQEWLGSCMPDEFLEYAHHDAWSGFPDGLAFDRDDVLWYPMRIAGGTYLCSWDYLRGGRPKSWGLAGTVARVGCVFSDARIHGALFAGSDTNHEFDPPSVFCADLDALKEDAAAGVAGPLTADPQHYAQFIKGYDIYPAGDLCRDWAPMLGRKEAEIERARPYSKMAYDEVGMQNFKEVCCAQIWRHTGVGNSAVLDVKYAEDGTLQVLCGVSSFYRLTVRRGEVIAKEELPARPALARDGLPEKYKGAALPRNAGRGWVAQASAEAVLSDGTAIVGTRDGLVCLIKPDGAVISLGGVGAHGPVRDLCVNAAGTKAWGVAGDESDLGMLFTYAPGEGLVQIGWILANRRQEEPYLDGIILCAPNAVAVRGDCGSIAIGSAQAKSNLLEFIF